MNKFFNWRTFYLLGGSAIVLLWLWHNDPDKGLTTWMLIESLAIPILAVAMAHITRKLLLHYFNLEDAIKKALETSEGAGRVVVGVCIVIAALLMLFGGQVHAATIDIKTYIPANALLYAHQLKREQELYWPAAPRPELLGALVEQESCVTLVSPRCWSPKSRLKSAREEGAGLGQLTRAYRADGSLRFDKLSELREQYAEHLAELSWETVYSRPDLQMRAMTLMSRQLFNDFHRLVPDQQVALEFADAAYNGGFNGVQADRRKCQMTPGCDPHKWFGNVERTCTKSKVALYGTRNACDINRDHVNKVINIRATKYVALLAGKLEGN